jgi:hypothetical protein
MDCTAGAEAAYRPSTTGQAAIGPPATRSGKMELLAKWQAALILALRQGRENPVDRAFQILETALNNVLLTLERMADEEEWTSGQEAGED